METIAFLKFHHYMISIIILFLLNYSQVKMKLGDYLKFRIKMATALFAQINLY